jgi:hypothetical protein
LSEAPPIMVFLLYTLIYSQTGLLAYFDFVICPACAIVKKKVIHAPEKY